MLKDVRLYIAGKLVDLSESQSLPMTYQTEDFKNPTIVKNSFSKSITIPGTSNNHKIFGEIYKLDRLQHSGDIVYGVNYNPSNRVDFQIYKDGELVESGYVQLNSVSKFSGDIKYNITLFGGLGDFFYGLKYNEDGTQKTLADLQFFVQDKDGNVLPKDEELTFNINKEFVSECFDNKWTSDGNQITDIITFIPANNGLYEDFDNGHCLIAADGSTFPKTRVDGDDTYSTVNGFALATFEKDYTEWQIQDLRSYKQRPAIKVSKLIETICRKENSGYNVILDELFFSSNNPYWDKSFIALPLLDSDSEGDESNSSPLTQHNLTSLWVGKNGDNEKQDESSAFSPNTYFNVTDDYIDLSNLPDTSQIDVDLDLQVRLHPEDTADEWFPSALWRTEKADGVIGTSFTAQLLLVNESEEVVGYSNLYNFSYDPIPNYNANYMNAPNPDTWYQYNPAVWGCDVTTVYGSYKKIGDQYYWYTVNGGNTIRLTINNWMRTTSKVKLKLHITCQATPDLEDIPFFSNGIGYLYNKNSINETEIRTNFDNLTTVAWYEPLIDLSTSAITVKWENRIISNVAITKDMFLKTEASPADYLLSYAKLFGLYFVKDTDSKTITIYNRNSFFHNEVEDWTNKIDYSKEITITPLLFDKKWYRMSLETPETYFAKKYNTDYSLTYGQQRLDTGYNFNSETTDLYSDNVFENVISATDSDKYFRTFYNKNGHSVPAFLNDNITYTLYTVNDSLDIDIYGYNTIDTYKTEDWNSISGADIFAKPCFFSMDNEEKSLEEISNSLVFYNGHIDLKDFRGNEVPFWISDDLVEMIQLNDKEPCYLWTKYENFNGKKIAIKKNTLPQYISYLINHNTVNASFDFGLPKEMYMDRINYSADTTLYANFWDSFYRDQFDVNTKKVTCFVKLDQANQNMLRKFYWFDNSIWILNKIDGFDINSDGTTRCEFIKVQDMSNYLEGVQNYSIN